MSGLYTGLALGASGLQLAVVYQVSAVLILIATWSLFAIKIKKQAVVTLSARSL